VPKPFQFTTGSLIYAQGEDADRIFILQTGKASLVYRDMETGDDVRDQVLPANFSASSPRLAVSPARKTQSP